MRIFTRHLKNLFNVYQQIKEYANSGNILQCLSFNRNLKHFPALIKLKYSNVYQIFSKFEVQKYGKGQDFEKIADRDTAHRI